MPRYPCFVAIFFSPSIAFDLKNYDDSKRAGETN